MEDVSVPCHLHGAKIWDVIATEGATAQMVDGNGYGMNWQGLYDPELIEHYGRQWRADCSRFSENVKLVLLAGRDTLDRYHGAHYAMARNLVPRLRTHYDEALDQYDELLMPTTPVRATPLPAPDAPRQEVLGRPLEMVSNTARSTLPATPPAACPPGLSTA